LTGSGIVLFLNKRLYKRFQCKMYINSPFFQVKCMSVWNRPCDRPVVLEHCRQTTLTRSGNNFQIACSHVRDFHLSVEVRTSLSNKSGLTVQKNSFFLRFFHKNRILDNICHPLKILFKTRLPPCASTNSWETLQDYFHLLFCRTRAFIYYLYR